MKSKETKHEEGPRSDWGSWRARRDKQLAKPRRNKAAQKLASPPAIATADPDKEPDA